MSAPLAPPSMASRISCIRRCYRRVALRLPTLRARRDGRRAPGPASRFGGCLACGERSGRPWRSGLIAGAAGSASRPCGPRGRAPPYVDVWVPYWATTSGATRVRLDGQRRGDDQRGLPVHLLRPRRRVASPPCRCPPSVVAAIQQASELGKPVVPTITDGAGKGGDGGDPRRPRPRAPATSPTWSTPCVAGGYDGIDLDYEQFAFTDGQASWPTTMPNWVQFVAELSGALHAQGRQLYVTIPPVWSADAPVQDNTSANYWVYAQDKILPYVDKLRLMVYDWSPGTPSANAPLNLYVNPVVSLLVEGRRRAPGQPRSQAGARRPGVRAALEAVGRRQPVPRRLDRHQRRSPRWPPPALTGSCTRDAASGELTMSSGTRPSAASTPGRRSCSRRTPRRAARPARVAAGGRRGDGGAHGTAADVGDVHRAAHDLVPRRVERGHQGAGRPERPDGAASSSGPGATRSPAPTTCSPGSDDHADGVCRGRPSRGPTLGGRGGVAGTSCTCEGNSSCLVRTSSPEPAHRSAR